MKRFDIRNPSKSVMIFLILVIAVGFGILFDYICTCVEKAIYPRTYEEQITAYAEAYDVPTHLVFSVIKCESSFDSGAESKAGAIGLMQLMPDTFDWLTKDILKEHLDGGMIYDPETNIRYGTYYLSRLFRQYGSWELALAAYNAGPGRVNEWLADPELSDGEGGLAEIPWKETRRYVNKVMKAWKTYDRLYGVEAENLSAETASETTN